jgi:outer membrane lipoprotein-sorting protein
MVCRQSSILLVYLLVAPSCFAQTALDYLEKVAETYKHLKSLLVKADVERGQLNHRNKIKLSITLYVVPPDRVRIEAKDDVNILRSILISNGNSIIDYSVWKNEYSSYEGDVSVHFDPKRGTGLGEMLYDTIADGVRKASILGRQKIEVGKDLIPCVVVDVEYTGEKNLIAIFAFWIAENGLIFRRAVTFWDGNGIRTLVSSVTALTANEELPQEIFQFHPPPGATEVPMTSPAVPAAAR